MIISENNPFRTPWWASNAHVQTIASSLFSEAAEPKVERIEIPTPDDDFLELDLATCSESDAVTVLFHGLEGSSSRYYITNLMQALLDRKSSVVAVNFRGCGSKLNRQPFYYNAGATYDYQTVFEWVKDSLQPQQLYAAGFSLGANALVKYLGEEGSDALIDKAAAISPPFDLREGAMVLQKGFNRLYEAYFMRTLEKKLEMKRELFPGLPTYTGNSLYDFDDQITAVLHDYDGADDYYERCGSKNFYGDVARPLLVIHSKSDPICPFEFAPVEVMQANPNITTHFMERGGHVGFWSVQKNWINILIADWLTS